MRKFLLISCIIFMGATLFAQTESFTTGWYSIKDGALFKVIQNNAEDAKEKDFAVTYSVHEVLLVFNFSKDIYYCFDPDNRIVLVKGKSSLQKIDVPGRPVRITEEVKVGLDLTLVQGNNVWLTGYNSANKTAEVLLSDNTKVNIPQSSIEDLKDFYDMLDRHTDWLKVE